MRTLKTDLLADFVDLDAFAENVERHPRSVYRWMMKPNGLPYLKLGNRVLIPVEAARKWLDGQVQQNNPRRQQAKERQYEQAVRHTVTRPTPTVPRKI